MINCPWCFGPVVKWTSWWEHMEQNYFHVAGKQGKHEKERARVPLSPSRACSPLPMAGRPTTRPHFLKFLPHPNSTKLETNLLTHRPLNSNPKYRGVKVWLFHIRWSRKASLISFEKKPEKNEESRHVNSWCFRGNGSICVDIFKAETLNGLW